MHRYTLGLVLAACACLLAPAIARSADPTPSPPLLASETQFVASVTRDLQARFATTSAAAAGGYFRYTDEDNTGAISWVNTSNWTSDATHPSQLWYDVKGRLIGADFSIPRASSADTPQLWGVSPSRWITLRQHVHFGVKTATGMSYGGYGAKSAASINASLASPALDDVVKLQQAKSAADVAFAFPFPAIWDLQVWLVPNPNGAFARANPDVKPSVKAKSEM